MGGIRTGSGMGGMGTGIGLGGGGQGGSAGSGQGGSAGSGQGGKPVLDASVDLRPNPDTRPVDASVDRPSPDTRPADAGPTPTFTELYKDIFGFAPMKAGARPGCQGSECHTIGKGDRVKFATQKEAFDRVSLYIDKDMPDESSLLTDFLSLEGPRMPPTGWPKITQKEWDRIRLWIIAGAKNN